MSHSIHLIHRASPSSEATLLLANKTFCTLSDCLYQYLAIHFTYYTHQIYTFKTSTFVPIIFIFIHMHFPTKHTFRNLVNHLITLTLSLFTHSTAHPSMPAALLASISFTVLCTSSYVICESFNPPNTFTPFSLSMTIM